MSTAFWISGLFGCLLTMKDFKIPNLHWLHILFPLLFSFFGALFCVGAIVASGFISGWASFYLSSMYNATADIWVRFFFVAGFIMILCSWSIIFYVEFIEGKLRLRTWRYFKNESNKRSIRQAALIQRWFILATGFLGLFFAMFIIAVPSESVIHHHVATVVFLTLLLHCFTRRPASILISLPLTILAGIFLFAYPSTLWFSVTEVLLAIVLYLTVTIDIIAIHMTKLMLC